MRAHSDRPKRERRASIRRSNRGSMSVSADLEDQLPLQRLQAMSERRLREQILRPLFERMGFTRVEIRHGVHEKGIDILCIRHDELNEADLLGVQIKATPFSGKATSSGHLHGTLIQLRQCLKEPVRLYDGTERCLDRVWLLSPFVLNVAAIESSFSALRTGRSDRIKIVDGPKVLQLLSRYAPELLSHLGDLMTGYRKRLAEELPLMHEAAALNLREKFPLVPIYVGGDLSLLPPQVARLVKGILQPSVPKEEAIASDQLRRWLEFDRRVADEFGTHVSRIVRDSRLRRGRTKGRRLSRQQIDRAGFEAVIAIDATPLYSRLSDEARKHLTRMRSDGTEGDATVETRLQDLHRFATKVEWLFSQDESRRLFWEPHFVSPTGQRLVMAPEDRFSLDLDHLLKAEMNVQVIGGAGAGKTTLLRIIAQKLAVNAKGLLPIFVPLATLSPRESLLTAVGRACAAYGLPMSHHRLTRVLKSGKVLMLFDGVDEASARVEGVEESIRGLLKEFPKIRAIITARPWASLRSRGDMFTVRLLPMTPEQVNAFFEQWFRDEPELARQTIRHFARRPELYDAISTPLLTTIVAVVKAKSGRLPTSLLDVYSDRLRLLLHDWDAVRAIRRDRFQLRDKEFFLRKLAFALHSQRQRAMAWERIVDLALVTLGDIRSRAAAQEFVLELMQHNNVLFQEPGGLWGLGHLQYQEYLAALEAKENRTVNVLGFLDDGWWSSVVRMYAELTRDISGLISQAVRRGTLERDLFALHSLLEAAPNTESRSRGIVEKAWDDEVVVARSFGERPFEVEAW